MPIETEAAADGMRFIATAHGKTYRSLNYHRSPGGRTKSIWGIPRAEEFAVFCDADDGDWCDDRGYWAIRNGARDALGTRRERVAHFPEKAQGSDDWHGFPLFLSPVRRPNPDLADAWVEAELITFAVGEKIKRGKL